MWIQVAMFVASMVISQALQPKPQKPKAATLSDFDMPTTEDGTPKVVVFGDVWLTDWCVIGVGKFRTEAIIKKQKSLFGSKKITTGHRYGMAIHMGMALAVDDVVEIKVSDKTLWTGTLPADNQSSLAFNQPSLFGGDESEGGIRGTITFYRGAADQAVPATLTEMFGTAPAYRGCMTAIYDGILCSNSPYPKPWSFRVRRTVSGWDQGVWYADKATIWLSSNQIKAMNPAHIIYEAYTNRDWGRGLSRSQLDEASFKAAADTLYSEGFGMCLAYRRQSSIHEFIQEILDHIGGAIYLDRLTGLWRLSLIRQNYDPNTLPIYSYGNGLLRIEEDNNASNELAKNQTIVSYLDPISNENKPARAENLASIQQHGVIMENKTYNGLPTLDLAGRVAARDMKVAQSSLKRFKVVLDRRAYAMQPVSVFKLALPKRGIESIVLRAVRVEHATFTNGEITVTAVQDVFGLPATNFIKEQPSLYVAPDLTAISIHTARLFEVPYTHLLEDFSVESLSRMNAQAYIMPLALSPNQLHQDFNILAKTQSASSYDDVGTGAFAFSALIDHAIAQSVSQTVLNLTNVINIDLVYVGQCALIDDEIVEVKAINTGTNQVTVARGCIDTVPVQHASGARIWFYDGISNIAENSMPTGQALNFKLLSRTARNTLDSASAAVLSMTAQQRIMRPFPPANPLLNDVSYPAQLTAPLSKVSWSHRNRITQGTNVLDQLAASQSLETNASYIVKVYKRTTMTGAWQLMGTKEDIAVTQLFINSTDPLQEPSLTVNLSGAVMLRVEIYAKLDTLESLQKHVIDTLV